MSTKTSFKRIAAVAAVALALGGFSAVSASAAAGTATFTNASGSAISTSGATAVGTAVVGSYVPVTLTFTGDTKNVATVSSTGVGTLVAPTIVPPAGATSQVSTSGVSATSFVAYSSTVATDVPGTGTNTLGNLGSSNAGTVTFSLYSATAGTQTISVGDNTGTSTLTITWGAAAALVAQYATTQIVAGQNSINGVGTAMAITGSRYTGTSDVVVASSTYNVTQPSAIIGVALASAYDTAFAAPLTVSTSVAGAVGIAADASQSIDTTTASVLPQGSNVTNSGSNKFYRIYVWADGRAGTSTITISSGTTTIATKTVTFVGTATAVKATQVLRVAKAGSVLGVVNGAATSVATDPAFTVDVTDANGNPAALPTNWKVKSSASTVITVANSDCVQETGVPGTYDCAVQGAGGALSGTTATVTFSIAATSTEVADATTGLYSIKSDALPFAIGGSVATVALTTDASDYTPLAPIKLIATAKDSKGNAAYDKDFTNTGAATDLLVSLKSSSALAGGSLTSPLHLINGVATLTGIYAPSIESTVLITGVENVDGLATAATSATFTVSNGSVLNSSQAATDAAQEATDAANAAYDAANNAMDSADAATAAAQDASDNASAALAAVTSLSATVAKLVSSVTAIATALAAIKKKLGVK